MSLIPSESSSFADLLGRGLDGSKKSKWREPFPGPPAPALPDPPKSSPRSPALKEKPQAKKPATKTQKAPVVAKVEAKKSPASLPKKEAAPRQAPPPPAEPIWPVLESTLMDEIIPPLAPPPTIRPFQAPPAPAAEPILPVIEPDPFSPPPAILPVEAAPVPELVAAVQPVPPPEPIQPPQPIQTPQWAQPPQPVQRQPIIKAPLVIQPEDEPPRRPIPIVRVSRSKQNPHGIGRGFIAEPNGHDVLASQPPEPLSSPAPFAAAVPPPIAPRPRPKPPMLAPHLEEEPPAPKPAMRAVRGQIEKPQTFAPISPWPMAPQGDPAESDPWLVAEREWISESRPRRRLPIQWQSRLVRCLAYEAAAILVLFCAVLVGLAHRTPDDPLNLITRILAISAAVVAAIIPVLFYGLPERLPRDPR